MFKQAKGVKWWLALLTIGAILILLWRTGPSKTADTQPPAKLNANYTAAIRNNDNRSVLDINRDQVSRQKFDAEVEEGQKVNSPSPPRRRPQSYLLPDIVGPSATGGPQGAKEDSVNRPSPEQSETIATEAQLTLQTFLKKLTWQEKAMVLRTLNKFSPAEMLEVFQLYKQGSLEAYRIVPAIRRPKFSV